MTSSTHDGPVAPGFRHLFEPLQVGSFTLRNRIVNTSHGTSLGEARDLRYLSERARGGAALLGIGAAGGVLEFSVGPAAAGDGGPAWDRPSPHPLTDQGIAHYDAQSIPWLARRAEVVHAAGARCFAQVVHTGAGEHRNLLEPMLGPSSVPDPYEGAIPHALGSDEIEELIVAFAHGIRRAKEAGIDAVEIHGAHGYLVAQFLSPYFNRRTDKWGGSVEHRVALVHAIIAAARELVGPDYPIGVRIGYEGDGELRGMTVPQLAEIAALLSSVVAYISVSCGNYAGFGDGLETAYVSPWYREPGFNVPAGAAVRAAVDVPVLVTGRIVDPSFAESVIADGAADMVGMVRALIADPDLPNKARRGRAEEIRMCLGMSECHAIGARRVPLTCAVNAEAAREEEMVLVPTERPKEVAVIGAGPAGLETARVAALRGHHVYLCDRERTLGGTIRFLALDPSRRNLQDHAVYFETQLRNLDVEMLLGNEATADELAEFGLDAVVVATGGRPLIPDVPGIRDANVVTALDALRHPDRVGGRAVVVAGVDGNLGAPTVAAFLARAGRRVELVSEHFDFAHRVEDGTRLPLLHQLRNLDLPVSLVTKLVSVQGGGATLLDTFTREPRDLDDVTVVLACGLVADDTLARTLEGRVPEIHVIGDALAPRRMMHATVEGARVGRAL